MVKVAGLDPSMTNVPFHHVLSSSTPDLTKR
jgi:hypothetical protein